MAPTLTAAPLIKLIIDASAALHRRVVDRGLPQGFDHRSHPGLQWAKASVLESLGLWIGRIFRIQHHQHPADSEQDYPQYQIPNSDERVVVTSSESSSETTQLIYCIIAELSEVS